jgi:RNA polymerase sigma factor (sigma-70 family)
MTPSHDARQRKSPFGRTFGDLPGCSATAVMMVRDLLRRTRPSCECPMDPEALVKRYQTAIQSGIRATCARHRVTGNDASDLTSALWAHVLDDDARVLRLFEGRSSIRTYLFRILDRAAKEFVTREVTKRRVEVSSSDSILSDTPLPAGDMHRFRSDSAAILDSIFVEEIAGSLSVADRSVLQQYLEGWRCVEIGRSLGISARAADHRVRRILAKLRARFGTAAP